MQPQLPRPRELQGFDHIPSGCSDCHVPQPPALHSVAAGLRIVHRSSGPSWVARASWPAAPPQNHQSRTIKAQKHLSAEGAALPVRARDQPINVPPAVAARAACAPAARGAARGGIDMLSRSVKRRRCCTAPGPRVLGRPGAASILGEQRAPVWADKQLQDAHARPTFLGPYARWHSAGACGHRIRPAAQPACIC